MLLLTQVLTFAEHILLKIDKAYSMLALITRNFIYMDRNTFVLLYKSFIRPHLKYAVTRLDKVGKGCRPLCSSLLVERGESFIDSHSK